MGLVWRHMQGLYWGLTAVSQLTTYQLYMLSLHFHEPNPLSLIDLTFHLHNLCQSYVNLSASVSNQTVPIVLQISTEDKERLQGCQAYTLTYQDRCIAIVRNPDFYEHRKEERCARQWGTTNPGHPYIKVCIPCLAVEWGGVEWSGVEWSGLERTRRD